MGPVNGEHDRQRWYVLAVVVGALTIMALNTTILTVAIPSMMDEFDTDLPTVQWVVTGNSLVYAALLVIGGRLGDIVGHRRTLLAGLVLLALGGATAALAPSVLVLVAGFALLSGGGSALFVPATFSIISRQFEAGERATAFAVVGAVIGAGVAFGPLVGGFLTTSYSWRWSIGSTVVVAVVSVVAAVLVVPPDELEPHRARRLDGLGAAVLAVGIGTSIFALSEGAHLGWVTPLRDVVLHDAVLWRRTWPVSIVVLVLALAASAMVVFWRVERRRERDGRMVLFEFDELRRRGFRYGLLTSLVMSMGHVSLIFAVPILLQSGARSSATRAGLALVPAGLCMIAASQVGAVIARRFDAVVVVRIGLAAEAAGIAWVAFTIGADFGWSSLGPGLVCYGAGIGLASSQLTNVTIAGVPEPKVGMASGASSTVRQLGAGLGIAVVGALLSTKAVARAIELVQASTGLPAAVRRDAIDHLQANQLDYVPPPGTAASSVSELRETMAAALAHGARPSLTVAAALVAAGAALAWRIPRP